MQEVFMQLAAMWLGFLILAAFVVTGFGIDALAYECIVALQHVTGVS